MVHFKGNLTDYNFKQKNNRDLRMCAKWAVFSDPITFIFCSGIVVKYLMVLVKLRFHMSTIE